MSGTPSGEFGRSDRKGRRSLQGSALFTFARRGGVPVRNGGSEIEAGYG
jgi:hypothetical protein